MAELSSRIAEVFVKTASEQRLALMPFVMAGDPDLKSTAEVLISLQSHGADVVELGIPYSDPLADGPVIQAAAHRALEQNTTPAKVLEMLSGLREQLTMPVVLFTYSNPLLNRGAERFFSEAAAAGVSGLVVPDLPLEEAERLSPLAAQHGLDLVLLVAPTTPEQRMERIAASSRGFTYLVSVTGVTGERSSLQERVGQLVTSLKRCEAGPVAVGFGISGPDQVRQVRAWGADGAIVGSALVKRIAAAQQGCAAAEAGEFCRELRAAAG
ncbi:tryptophan synthase/ alpha subunit [Synechococcus sp. MIT S9220]|uniref:tryptophan synthase subunit alpha n=1 Tax=unclassified Synechococcus TaxID=2626047 RepID=UPI00164C85AE|nr:tryptophan synthase subunit alpha [Synechococcus sp. MIT S9220]NOL46468.1 tryptophan synthase subunit alpha [Synechococcus sp. MIT S9220]QNJ23424.1 tryptophan synthase/ alpha subunit [Synechococcus sp. MIT S9220]